eukprot:INCI6652.1.p1 GENE.INCI6652.1~~INCI6652.1.p1  ORF type:complete len:476 (-),score=83.91 INCI6652.1:567-1994(-)
MACTRVCTRLKRYPPQFYVHFVVLTVLFFLSSGGLTLYNKWIISVYGFDFPVWLVTSTYTVAAIFAISTRLLTGLPLRCCQRGGCCGIALRRAGIFPFTEDVYTPRKLGAIFGVGVMAAIEVATSNVSLLYLDVSYHIMLRAAIPVFVVLWAFVLRLEEPNLRLLLVVVFICGGVVVLSYGESSSTEVESGDGSDNGLLDADSDGMDDSLAEAKLFSWTGTFYVLGSCFCAGCKWALSELTLNSKDEAFPSQSAQVAARGQESHTRHCCCGYARLDHSEVELQQLPKATTDATEVTIDSDSDDEDGSHAASNARSSEQPALASGGQVPVVEQGGHENVQPDDKSSKVTPFSLLSVTALVSALSLLPVDFLSDEFEGIQNYTVELTHGAGVVSSQEESELAGVHMLELVLVLVGCALISVVLSMVTFLFIKLTSGLTLSIVNIVKQLIVIAASIGIYGDSVTLVTLGGFGLFVCAY